MLIHFNLKISKYILIISNHPYVLYCFKLLKKFIQLLFFSLHDFYLLLTVNMGRRPARWYVIHIFIFI